MKRATYQRPECRFCLRLHPIICRGLLKIAGEICMIMMGHYLFFIFFGGGSSDFLISFLSHYPERTKICYGRTYDMYHYLFFYDFCLFLFHPIIRRGARLAEVICPHQQILLLLHGIQDRLYTPKAEKKKDFFSIVGRTDYNVFYLMVAPIKMFPHFDKAIARNAGPSV